MIDFAPWHDLSAVRRTALGSKRRTVPRLLVGASASARRAVGRAVRAAAVRPKIVLWAFLTPILLTPILVFLLIGCS